MLKKVSLLLFCLLLVSPVFSVDETQVTKQIIEIYDEDLNLVHEKTCFSEECTTNFDQICNINYMVITKTYHNPVPYTGSPEGCDCYGSSPVHCSGGCSLMDNPVTRVYFIKLNCPGTCEECTNAGFEWCNRGWLEIKTGDNDWESLSRKVDLPSSGYAKIVMIKQADYPTDNAQAFYIKQDDNNYYKFSWSGSGYDSQGIYKIVAGNTVDSSSMTGTIDTDGKEYTIEMWWDPSFMRLDINGQRVKDVSTIDTTELNPTSFTLKSSQIDLGLKSIEIYNAYGGSIGSLIFSDNFQDQGLVAHWDMDENSGSIVRDSSGYDNDGKADTSNPNTKILAIGDHYSTCYISDYDVHYYNPESGTDLVPDEVDGINLYDFDVIYWRGDDELNPSASDIDQLKTFLQKGKGIYDISAGMQRDGLSGQDFHPGSSYGGSGGNYHILTSNHYVTSGYSGDYKSCVTQCYSAGYNNYKSGATALAKETSGCCGGNTYTMLAKEWNGGKVFWAAGCTADSAMFHRAIDWLSPTANWVEGKYGSALEFDGVDDYVEVPDIINSSNSFSVGAWVKTFDLTRPEWETTIVNQRIGAVAWTLYQGSDSKFKFTVWHNGSVAWTAVSPTIEANKWYHITGVYNKEDSNIKIYLNGIASSPVTTTDSIADVATSTRIGWGANANRFFNGIIDDVRIYNRALSAGEIKSLYESEQYIWEAVDTKLPANAHEWDSGECFQSCREGGAAGKCCTSSIVQSLAITGRVAGPGVGPTITPPSGTICTLCNESITSEADCDSLYGAEWYYVACDSTPANCFGTCITKPEDCGPCGVGELFLLFRYPDVDEGLIGTTPCYSMDTHKCYHVGEDAMSIAESTHHMGGQTTTTYQSMTGHATKNRITGAVTYEDVMPNITRGDVLEFVVNAFTDPDLLSQCIGIEAGGPCTASFTVEDDNGVKIYPVDDSSESMPWDFLEEGWLGSVNTSILGPSGLLYNCDKTYTIVVNVSSPTASGQISKDFFVNCVPSLTVTPKTLQLALGQNIYDNVFKITIKNPTDDNFLGGTLTMTNPSPYNDDSILAQLAFVGAEPGNNDQLTDITIPSVSHYEANVFMERAHRSDSYKMLFAFTANSGSVNLNDRATINIFSEALTEFGWIHILLVLSLAAVFV
ncbi:MAG: LamG domain-containing protein [Candidatus Aenigmarchaeota archaeon]|nr:LamG domain-containing protein [Candidatus Aenigmarchaeota archaeon]